MDHFPGTINFFAAELLEYKIDLNKIQTTGTHQKKDVYKGIWGKNPILFKRLKRIIVI